MILASPRHLNLLKCFEMLFFHKMDMKMKSEFESSIVALDALIDFISNASKESKLATETYGYTHPALYPADLADLVVNTKEKITTYGNIELTESEIKEIEYIPLRVNSVLAVLAPQFFNGNGAQAIPAFIATFVYINSFLDNIFSLSRLDKEGMLPKTMTRKLKSLDARIKGIEPDIESLEDKIKLINDAHAAAEDIPVDLDELRGYNKDAQEIKDKISKIQFNLESAEETGQKKLDALSEKEIKAAEYLALCEEAIRASTSKGLAGAFEIKADKLNNSIRAWVGGLMLSLSLGGWFGFKRFEVLSTVLKQDNPNTTVIITQLLLSVFSIAAPLWFAWLATKQINQRWKLAEDYAFKSSVAKAYEGYKNEAKRVSDGEFEKRLFDSALTRLEEAPLRLIKGDDHSTPWSELLSSKSFQKFLDASIENVQFVRGIINKKIPQPSFASNDAENKTEKKQADV